MIRKSAQKRYRDMEDSYARGYRYEELPFLKPQFEVLDKRALAVFNYWYNKQARQAIAYPLWFTCIRSYKGNVSWLTASLCRFTEEEIDDMFVWVANRSGPFHKMLNEYLGEYNERK